MGQILVVRCDPITLMVPSVIDPQIPGNAKYPAADVVDLQPVVKTAVEAKKSLLGNLFCDRVPASHGPEISEYGVAQLDEPSLDFPPELGRAGI
jgi:hypothetical protein